MEKVITGLKILYALLVASVLIVFGRLIYLDYVNKMQFYTFGVFISALFIILLVIVVVTAIFLIVIGLLRKISAKGDAEKQSKANKLIMKGVWVFLLAFLAWFAINLYSVFAYSDIDYFEFVP